MKRINVVIVWRKCHNFRDWSIDSVFIDSSYGNAKEKAKKYMRYHIPNSERKFIGLKEKITKAKMELSNLDYKFYLKELNKVGEQK